jgi:uncharacterized protein YdgA (DUF945 family)
MKKGTLVAVPLIIVAAAAGATPWYAGMRAEQAMRTSAETFGSGKQSPFAVSYTRFERGWLKSEAVSRIAVKADPSIYFEVRHEISHMPNRAGWVRVHSVPQLSGVVKANLDYYFGGQPPIAVDTVVGYDGTHVMQFYSPAFSKPLHQQPEMTVSWGGMQGTLTIDANDHWVGSAVVPSLAVEGGDTQATLTELKIDGAWDVRGTAIDWQGETKMGMSEFRVVTPLQQFALKDVTGATYQRSNGNSVLIGYALRIGFGSAAHAGATSQTISNAVLELELDKLDKKALSKYIADLSNAEQLTMAPDARARLAAQLVMNLGGDLLRGSPELRMKQLGVETPAGSVLAHAVVTFDGSNLSDIPFSPELLARIKAKADVKLSGALLRTQLQQQVRSQVEVALRQQGGLSTEENIRAMSEKVIDDQLKGYTDAGLLRANGADFIIEAEFAAGQMLVNGLPANQLFGGMLAAPAPAAPLAPEKVPEREAAAPAGSTALAQPPALPRIQYR